MKKLISLLMIIMMLALAGCGKSDVDTDTGREDVSDSGSDTDEIQDDDNSGDKEAKPVKKVKKYTKDGKTSGKKSEGSKVDLDETYFEEIGLTVEDLEAVYGEMSESYWENGPIYRFGENENWYAFEQYDFAEDNSYIPLGKCNCVFVPMSKLITTGECSADALEQALGAEFSEDYDEMDSINVYSCEYNGLNIAIYAQSRAHINAQSVVNIKK